MKHGPHNITYADLIRYIETNISWMEKNHPRMKLSNQVSAHAADHRLACAKAIAKLLKAHRKDPQLNLNDLFNRP